jgi:thiamine kinase-like enzyme
VNGAAACQRPNMQPGDIASLARSVIPGTGTLDIEPVSVGLVNEVYRVVRGNLAYALRVASGRSGYQDPGWEARVLAAACSAGLAPPLELFDPERGIFVLRWVEGRPWTRMEAQASANIGRIADLLHRVHALAVPAPTRRMNPKAWMDLYGAALSSRESSGRDTGLREAAASTAAQLAQLPSTSGALCHSDLHLQNLLQSGTALMLLDWEYAHVSDPLWDVAGWSANNDFEHELRRELLANYLGNAPSELEWKRFGLLAWLFDYVCLLWSELYLCSKPDPQGAIAARARLLDARLRIPAN